jgi:hypothetical protein
MKPNSLQARDIGELPVLAVCYFGSCKFAAALGTHFPSRYSLSVSLSVQARTQNHHKRT